MTLPSVLDPFSAIARSDPGRPAVADNGTTAGYGRPADRAGSVADLVATRAPGPHPPVAVTPRHGVRDIAALTGVPAAGRDRRAVPGGPADHAGAAPRAIGRKELAATAETDRPPGADRAPRPHRGPSHTPARDGGEPVGPDGVSLDFTPADSVPLDFTRTDGDTGLEEIPPPMPTRGLVVPDDADDDGVEDRPAVPSAQLPATLPAHLVPDRIAAVPGPARTRTGRTGHAATRDRYL
ncbi:hypothetical protein ACPCBC_01850 [Streptomyces incarnatus]